MTLKANCNEINMNKSRPSAFSTNLHNWEQALVSRHHWSHNAVANFTKPPTCLSKFVVTTDLFPPSLLPPRIRNWLIN